MSTTTTKPRPILVDMPIHIKAKIAEHVPVFPDRMVLRKVSKEFKEIVDTCATARISLEISIHWGQVVLEVDDTVFEYTDRPNGCRRRVFRMDGFRKKVEKKERVPDTTYMNMATRHFAMLALKPKLVFRRLDVKVYYPRRTRYHRHVDAVKEELLGRIQWVLARIGRPLPVEQFLMCYSNRESDVLAILPFLKPSVLRSLKLSDYKSTSSVEFGKIVNTRQWDGLRELEVQNLPAEKIPVEKLANLSNFQLDLRTATMDQLQSLVKFVLRSRTIKSGKLRVASNNVTFRQMLGDQIRQITSEKDCKTRVFVASTQTSFTFIQFGSFIKFDVNK